MLDRLSLLELLQNIDGRIERALRRAAHAVRGTLVTSTSPTGRLLGSALFRAGELEPHLEVAQHYGFASLPPPATEVIAVPIGGSSAHRVSVGELDPYYRPVDLVVGDACLYSMGEARVYARLTGSVEVWTAAGLVVSVTTAGQVLLAGGGPPVARVGDSVTITGLDSVSGPITATGIISSGSALVLAGG